MGANITVLVISVML